MAYMSQEKKKVIAAAMKVALKDSGLKYSLSVPTGYGIVMTIKAGPVDFYENYTKVSGKGPHSNGFIDVNPYWYNSHFDGDTLKLLQTIFAVLNDGNHNRSDSQSDYFDVGWYVEVSIGKWDKPYILTK